MESKSELNSNELQHCTNIAEAVHYLDSIPPKNYAAFLKRIRINGQVFSLRNLLELDKQALENRHLFIFLEVVNDWPLVQGLIKNIQDLIALMEQIPLENRWDFFEKLNDWPWVKNLIKDRNNLMDLVLMVSWGLRLDFLEKLNDWPWLKRLFGDNLSNKLCYFPSDKSEILKSKLASDTVIPPNKKGNEFFSANSAPEKLTLNAPTHFKPK